MATPSVALRYRTREIDPTACFSYTAALIGVKMKRRTVLFLSIAHIFFIFSACTGTNPAKTAPPRIHPQWLKTYNSARSQDIFNSIRRTGDGGYIVAGKVYFQEGYLSNFKEEAGIVKLDAGGNIVWQYGFGEQQVAYEFFFAEQTKDGGFFAIGRSNWQSLLVKLDANGVLQWQQLFRGHLLHSYVQTANGDYILTGNSNAFGTDTSVTAVRLGSDGQCRWQKVYGQGEGRLIRRANDGGFVVLAAGQQRETYASGRVMPIGAGGWEHNRHRTIIMKLDPSGDLQWEKLYRGSLNAIETTAEGYILAGTAYPPPKRVFGAPFYVKDRAVPSGPYAVNEQGWILMLDLDGNEQRQRLYGGVFKDEFLAMRRTSDGSLVVLGYTDSYGAGNGDLWLLNIAGTGVILWQKAIGGPNKDKAIGIELSNDGGYVIVAHTLSLVRGAGLPMLLKTDKNGNMPGIALPLFHPSDAVADDDEDEKVEASEHASALRGQNVSLLSEKTALTRDVLSLVPAGFWPTEPKMMVSTNKLTVRQFKSNRKNMRYVNTLDIRNIGGADLMISKIAITDGVRSSNPVLSLLALLWQKISRKPAKYTLETVCTAVKPGATCSNKLTIELPSVAERRAAITITSNDPVNPVITIPVEMTVEELPIRS